MLTDSLRQREIALENVFFHRVDKQLLADIRADFSRMGMRAALREATLIVDDLLLDELIRMEVTPLTLSAVSLSPVILIAWADGQVDPKERKAILKIALADGVSSESPVWKLIESWLVHRPSPELAASWWRYITHVSHSLTTEARSIWLNHLIDQAKVVAKASGGFLGIGAISAEERRIIERLEQLLFED